jgi:16S rRNA processing protein RimM
MAPSQGEPYIATGRIIKPFGVLGWVKVASLTSNPDRFRAGNSFMVEGREPGPRLVIEAEEGRGGELRVKFEGVDDREGAEKLAGRLLLLRPEELGEAPQDAFWEHELLGLAVETTDGRPLGEVTEVIETGANDVLVVSGERECLIPVIEEVVKAVDLEKRVMIIQAIPGLLEE